jgi:hypothetical protein
VIYKYKGFEASAYQQGAGFRLAHQHGETFPEPTTTNSKELAAEWIGRFNAAADAQKIEIAERETFLRLAGFDGDL